MTDNLDPWSVAAYREGIDPVTWALQCTEQLIEVHALVTAGRATDPNSYPGYVIELTDTALANRIVGLLLDAGWTPPNTEPGR